ncbi:DUF6204 family protein [Amycolatopsis sp. NPDC051128]|uniref:DUF6204 family protein n=1 Tax=Amycolatopsis sp. NPDC051128 TaxID=3155412 RepID=UPI003445E692
MPTYRVLVRGKFDRPGEVAREKLLSALGTGGDDLTGQVFSPEGTLTYSPHLGGFSYRVEVDVDAGAEAAQQAHDHAELMVMELMDREGYPYRDLVVSSTCLDDLRARRRGQAARTSSSPG